MIDKNTTLTFDRNECRNLAHSGRREWLVTNGIGGFASGTVAGLLTRRYHGLLIAALSPPLGRTLLASKLDETAEYGGRSYPLSTNRWADGRTEPSGYRCLERFRLEGTTPVWAFAIGDALLEKRIWMRQGANTTYIRYDLLKANAPLALRLKALVNYRDYHRITRTGEVNLRAEPTRGGLRVGPPAGGIPLYLLSDRADATAENEWHHGFYLSVEAYRGLDDTEDHMSAGSFSATLEPGSSVTIKISTDGDPILDDTVAYQERQARERELLSRARDLLSPETLLETPLRQLVLAADQFIVSRSTAGDDGRTVIAGYPWFGDWGRDTMIALAGLTLCTGRQEVAARILRTFADYVDQGMLPNRFPDDGEEPEYNTVDATLWFFEAVASHHEATGDDDLIGDLFPVLHEIIDWHFRGTRHNIHVDAADGLLFAGEDGVQLTWMDAKVDDWVVTPRIGKPVEVNALWYNALRCMGDFARGLGKPDQTYEEMADRVRSSFDRFWNGAAGYCYDVLDTPDGSDASLRPNQILAVSLPHSPLSGTQQRFVVDVCRRNLITPHGLRSLAPDDPAFIGRYAGDRRQRDGAYHQGTIWAWLIGPFVNAHLRVHGDPEQARSFLLPLLSHVRDHGVGSISEIFDGDAPFTPRGCTAQAWSVAEVLRAWAITRGE